MKKYIILVIIIILIVGGYTLFKSGSKDKNIINDSKNTKEMSNTNKPTQDEIISLLKEKIDIYNSKDANKIRDFLVRITNDSDFKKKFTDMDDEKILKTAQLYVMVSSGTLNNITSGKKWDVKLNDNGSATVTVFEDDMNSSSFDLKNVSGKWQW